MKILAPQREKSLLEKLRESTKIRLVTAGMGTAVASYVNQERGSRAGDQGGVKFNLAG